METKLSLLLGGLLALLVYAKGEDVIEGTNLCDKLTNNGAACECITEHLPVSIHCEGIGLHAMYEQTDWLATFDAMNISMENSTLDIRFNDNNLQELPRFPPMPVITLIFKFNKISFIENKAFSELKQLRSLDLSHNNLTYESLNEGVFMGNNASTGYFPLQLTHLNLSYNRIHSLDKNAFDHLTMLKTLDLSHNPLKTLSGSTSIAISHLKKLEVLGLRSTRVSSMHEGMLHDLIELVSLNLAYNEFVKVPEELGFTHKLEVLNLDHNRFETLDKNSFVGLDFLEDLSLRNNERLKSVEEGTFGMLKNLTKLDLSFCKRLETLSDGAFNGIIENKNQTATSWKLTDIRLNDNGLAQIDDGLAPWDMVDYIDIRNNPFRCDCNLEWMMKVLMKKIQKIKPSLTEDLNCAQPKDMKGKSLKSLEKEPDLFSRCRDSKDELFPDEISLIPSGSYRAAGITILVIGVLLIVLGGAGIVFMVIKRRAIAKALASHQEIRYERADSDDDGIGSLNSKRGRF